MAEKQGSWGGAREGAGAKSKWQRSEQGTKLVRIPVAIESEVLEAARAIDIGIPLVPADVPYEFVTNSYYNELVTKSSQRIQQLESELEHLLKERDRLAQELAACRFEQPQLDLEGDRDRYLVSLRLGKQAPEYKRTRKALDGFVAFIRSSQDT